MRRERHIGYEIKALSNLMRRKLWEMHVAPSPDCDEFTEMQGMLLGFLCRNRDQEIFQKTLEEAFSIQRSTASRLLKQMEADGLIVRLPVNRDARLKRVVATPRAEALNEQATARIRNFEELLTRGVSQEELDQFMATLEKIRKNLEDSCAACRAGQCSCPGLSHREQSAGESEPKEGTL